MRRPSGISGWGVYAAQPIAEDTRIVEYKGQLVSQAEAWRREQRYLPRQRIWIFTIDARWARDVWDQVTVPDAFFAASDEQLAAMVGDALSRLHGDQP